MVAALHKRSLAELPDRLESREPEDSFLSSHIGTAAQQTPLAQLKPLIRETHLSAGNKRVCCCSMIAPGLDAVLRPYTDHSRQMWHQVRTRWRHIGTYRERYQRQSSLPLRKR